MGYANYYTSYGGTPPPRTGASHATIAPYGPYRTRDGAVVVADAAQPRWARFCAHVLEQPRFSPMTRVSERTHRASVTADALAAIVECVFHASHVCRGSYRLVAADIANARFESRAGLRRPSSARRARLLARDRLAIRAAPRLATTRPDGRLRRGDGTGSELGQHTHRSWQNSNSIARRSTDGNSGDRLTRRSDRSSRSTLDTARADERFERLERPNDSNEDG
jgi:crotonobetainyl-CoA:carnitine CoA-transferase CaiB-like acyl-CoA transferase